MVKGSNKRICKWVSRVDMTADYFNHDINLNDLYDALSKNEITVRDHQDRNG